MKVLFLDIDGVMNSSESARANGTYDVLVPTALAWLKSLSDAGIKVVVSSTWRKRYGRGQLSNKLGVPVHDVTPILPWNPKVVRGDEIAAWLEKNPEVTSFAIIDDDSDMLDKQRPFFVHTDTSFGMQKEHFDQLCKLLQVG